MSSPALLSAEATLEAIVTRCRRRAGLVLFVRYSVVACAVTLGAASAIQFVQPERLSAATLNLMAVALGIVSGAVAASQRYPTPRKVASGIDRHLQIDDSVVAALQSRESKATVAPLIVRQAVQRTADLNARDVFPMDLWRPAFLLAAALLLVAAVLPRDSNKPNTSVAGRSMPASAGSGAAAAGKQGQRPSTSAEQLSRNSPQRSESGSAATAKPQMREAEASAQSRQATARDARGGISAGTNDGRNGTGTARSAVRAESGGSGAAGTGAPRGTGAGGVRSGDLLSSSRPSKATVSSQRSSRFGQAQRNAEAALTRGDIPPELRSYVREYFRAITR